MTDEVLGHALAILRDQLENGDWMSAERESVAAHIALGFEQAQRGELISAEDAVEILRRQRAVRGMKRG